MAYFKFKKICCLIYSGLLFISGLVLMGTSAFLLFRIFYHYTFIPSETVGPFFVIFLLGIIHLLLTWLGNNGPTKEHSFHILLFIIITAVLMVCELAVGVWSFILWDDVDVETMDLMTSTFEELAKLNYYNKRDWKYWNKLQSQFQCCGVNGVGDYNKTDSYPASCFSVASDLESAAISSVYQEGCKWPFIKYIKSILMDGVIIGFVCPMCHGLGIYIFYLFLKALREAKTERMARRIAVQREMVNSGQHLNPAESHSDTLRTSPRAASTSPVHTNMPKALSANPPGLVPIGFG